MGGHRKVLEALVIFLGLTGLFGAIFLTADYLSDADRRERHDRIQAEGKAAAEADIPHSANPFKNDDGSAWLAGWASTKKSDR